MIYVPPDYKIIIFIIASAPIVWISRFSLHNYRSHGFYRFFAWEAILGAAILGVGDDEAIHSILDITHAKQPYTTIQRTMHIHPTVSELIPTMLDDLKPLQ